jgi:hypothetical protein
VESAEWQQMRFKAPDGHAEILWVQPDEQGTFRVLNVPVWQYGVSVGSRVSGQPGERWLEYERVVEDSKGATVRVYIPADAPITPASRFYLERILPDCRDHRFGVGPATFFDPRVVAIHVRERSDWDTRFADYLNGLADEGLIQLWEVGDPDAYPPDEPEEPGEYRELVHPRPTPQPRGARLIPLAGHLTYVATDGRRYRLLASLAFI